MIGCQTNRYHLSGYLNLPILTEYSEYANSLCEFLFNTIVLDYVVKTSVRNHQSLIRYSNESNQNCVSLYKINLDTDFLVYEEKIRKLCAMSKSTLYEIKMARIAHPTWIVRFTPNFKRTLSVFAFNLRNLIKRIEQIETFIGKTNLSGEILRYHAITTALTTIKYDLLTLYIAIRSGGLKAMKTSFLYPILSDIQRWLTYTFNQIKILLSTLPGSNTNRSYNEKFLIKPTKQCVSSMDKMTMQLKKTLKQSEENSQFESKSLKE